MRTFWSSLILLVVRMVHAIEPPLLHMRTIRKEMYFDGSLNVLPLEFPMVQQYHNPEWSCDRKRETDWPNLKKLMRNSIGGVLTPKGETGAEQSLQYWQDLVTSVYSNSDLQFCPLGLYTLHWVDFTMKLRAGYKSIEELPEEVKTHYLSLWYRNPLFGVVISDWPIFSWYKILGERLGFGDDIMWKVRIDGELFAEISPVKSDSITETLKQTQVESKTTMIEKGDKTMTEKDDEAEEKKVYSDKTGADFAQMIRKIYDDVMDLVQYEMNERDNAFKFLQKEDEVFKKTRKFYIDDESFEIGKEKHEKRKGLLSEGSFGVHNTNITLTQKIYLPPNYHKRVARAWHRIGRLKEVTRKMKKRVILDQEASENNYYTTIPPTTAESTIPSLTFVEQKNFFRLCQAILTALEALLVLEHGNSNPYFKKNSESPVNGQSIVKNDMLNDDKASVERSFDSFSKEFFSSTTNPPDSVQGAEKGDGSVPPGERRNAAELKPKPTVTSDSHQKPFVQVFESYLYELENYWREIVEDGLHDQTLLIQFSLFAFFGPVKGLWHILDLIQKKLNRFPWNLKEICPLEGGYVWRDREKIGIGISNEVKNPRSLLGRNTDAFSGNGLVPNFFTTQEDDSVVDTTKRDLEFLNPACQQKPHQMEWFLETKLIEVWISMIRDSYLFVPASFRKSQGWLQTMGYKTIGSSEAVSSSKVLTSSVGTTPHSVLPKGNVNVRRVVRSQTLLSFYPDRIENEDEAWIVLLSADFPETSSSLSGAIREKWSTAIENLRTYILAIRVLAFSVLRRATIRRPFIVFHTNTILKRVHEWIITSRNRDLMRMSRGKTAVEIEAERIVGIPTEMLEKIVAALQGLLTMGLEMKYTTPEDSGISYGNNTIATKIAAKDATGTTTYGNDRSARSSAATVKNDVATDNPDSLVNQNTLQSWFSKIKLWSFTEYKRLVYLDADMLVLRNIEELFTIVGTQEHEKDFAVPISSGEIVIGLMVIRPNLEIYEHIREVQREVFGLVDKRPEEKVPTTSENLKSKKTDTAEVRTTDSSSAEHQKAVINRAGVRSIDQLFQHAYWYNNGMLKSGYAEFEKNDHGGYSFTACEDQYPFLDTPKMNRDIPERFKRVERFTKVETNTTDTTEVNINMSAIRNPNHEPPNHEPPNQSKDFKVCLLSLEYHFAVTYPQVNRQLRYPSLYTAYVEGQTFKPRENHHSTSDDTRQERKQLQEEKTKNGTLMGHDHLLKIIAEPEKYAKLLHWPGSRRKPWLHYTKLARTYYDNIWWHEWERLKRAVEG